MAEKTPKVVVVGCAYVDMAIRCSQIPMAGQNFPGSELSYTPTGMGVNQAIQAALCNCSVHLISKIGGDGLGLMIKEALAEYNVNTDFVFVAEAKNTGVIVTLVNALGENAVCTYAGTNAALLPEDIDAAEQIIAEANVCLIQGRMPQNSVVKAVSTAKLYGKKVILNPAKPIASAESLESDVPAEYFNADIILLNLYEAAKIADHSDANIRDAKLIGSDLVARGAPAAVITMGKRGCMVVDRNGADHIPAFQINLVDQTCTGDSFAGALAACLTTENDLRKAVKFASAAGALACTKFGCVESLPTEADIIELLQKESAD